MTKVVMVMICLLSLLSFSANSKCDLNSESLLSKEEVKEVVLNTISALQNIYIFSDKAEIAVNRLELKLQLGEFNRQFNIGRLSRFLEQVLISSTGDSNFGINSRKNFCLTAEASHANFESSFTVEIVENNIAFLIFDGDFVFTKNVEEINSALSQLPKIEAIVIDLRTAHTGSISLSQNLLSFFLPADSHLATIEYSKNEIEPIHSLNLTEMEHGLHGTPVFIINSSFVAGPWEFFSHTMKHFGKAKIVGDDSMGIGLLTKTVRVSKNIELTLTYAELKNGASNNGWHKTGVAADYQVTAAEAQEVAFELARKVAR